MSNLTERIKKNSCSFCEWLIMDLAITFLPIIIKLIFSTITGLDIYYELSLVALLLSANTLKILYNQKGKENVGNPIFWISIFVLIISTVVHGRVIEPPPGIGATEDDTAINSLKIPILLVLADISSVLMSFIVWYKSVGEE